MANSTRFSPPCCSICKSVAPSPATRPSSKVTNTPGPIKSNHAAQVESKNSRLETSFVNVPYSPPTAYAHPSTHRKEWHGSEMYEATRRTEDMLSAIEEIVGRDDRDSASVSDTYYCKSCLERIEQVLDEQSAILMNECKVYDEAASKEEERVDSIRGALSKLANNINLESTIDEENAVEWALDQFNLEIQSLEQACKEQEQEIVMLQNVMREQIQRSKAIDAQEQSAFHELNALEREAHNFNEESHHISNMCSSVFTEIDSLSRVKLMTIPFHIGISQHQTSGYPLINNLRLAYRTNEKASLHRKEINAAWVQAAQLVAFTCGLYPDFPSLIRIIPLSYPCAKIQITGAPPSGGEGKTKLVYNLGWDEQASADDAKHISTAALIAFLSLLSDLAFHIISESGTNVCETPPFEMTRHSIDGADVTKLLDSDSAWSSVVYCMACNLHWLSKLPVRVPCIL